MKTGTDIDARWRFVKEGLLALRERYDAVGLVANAVMLPPESPLCEPLYETGHDLIKAMSLLVGDECESIDWFVNECDFGRKRMAAGCHGDMRVIDDYGKLRWLVELQCGA